MLSVKAREAADTIFKVFGITLKMVSAASLNLKMVSAASLALTLSI